MTVQALIEVLEKEDPNAIVCYNSSEDVFTFPIENIIKTTIDICGEEQDALIFKSI